MTDIITSLYMLLHLDQIFHEAEQIRISQGDERTRGLWSSQTS